MVRRYPSESPAFFIEQLRQTIAGNLRIEPERIRYGPLPGNVLGKLGTTGDHWQIYYRDQWRELPWHPEGFCSVKREHVRRWHGVPTRENEQRE